MVSWMVRLESGHLRRQASLEPYRETSIEIALSGEEIACMVALRG